MFHRFRYESAYYPVLDRLPLYARMKLDLTGIKLSLNQWLDFAIEERRVICHLPIDSDEEIMVFVEYVNLLCKTRCGSAAQFLQRLDPALWNTHHIPPPVLDLSLECGRTICIAEWSRWQFHERYALYKTAISKNEPEKFSAVLLELQERKTES